MEEFFARNWDWLGDDNHRERLLVIVALGAATIGTAHPSYATRLNNLAGLLQDMDRHGEAKPL